MATAMTGRGERNVHLFDTVKVIESSIGCQLNKHCLFFPPGSSFIRSLWGVFHSRCVHVPRLSTLRLQKDKRLISSTLRLDITPSYESRVKILRVFWKYL